MMNNQTQKLMFSSSSDEYETPRWLFDALDDIFHFTVDVAASDESHMCPKYYTKRTNGLMQSWKDDIVFINPPYSKDGVGSQAAKWCRKVSYEQAAATVMLLPARTETKLWHQHVWRGADQILFLKGRLKFINRQSLTYKLIANLIANTMFAPVLDMSEILSSCISRAHKQYIEITGKKYWRGVPNHTTIMELLKSQRDDPHMSVHTLTPQVLKISSAPFPSAVVMYYGNEIGNEYYMRTHKLASIGALIDL